MVEANPFQPPSAPIGGAPISDRAAFTADEIAEARRRLAEHAARPSALDRDREMEGRRFGRTTVVAGSIALIGSLTVLVGVGMEAEPGLEMWDGTKILFVFGGAFVALVAFLVFLSALITDLRVGRRAQATDPKGALTRWLWAARAGKAGYTFVALAPTARGWSVSPPLYTSHEPPPASIVLSDPAAMKPYLKGFARPGHGFVRWLQARRIKVVREDGDLAVVEAELTLTKWPQWANILTLVLFLVVRLIGLIVGLVLFFALRKSAKLAIQKTLLRGPDGLWYLLDADLRR